MFTRHVTMKLKANSAAEFNRIIENEALPLLRKQKGFRDEITFVATDVRQTGATTLELTGDLTIRGVTNSVTVPFEFEGAATDPFGNLRVGFEGSTVINRKDFGITWNTALETGGVLVSDKITLEFEVSAIKTA